ncbi:uncharacterized protein STAUR_6810 [Stigmatella aurantiaca DW4/3-1]|nr:uncharacterized protein STAUR_6810 [Stigmatella aurantiaca DW4/3-1]
MHSRNPCESGSLPLSRRRRARCGQSRQSVQSFGRPRVSHVPGAAEPALRGATPWRRPRPLPSS